MKQKLYLFIMGFLIQAGLFAQSIPNISYAPQKFSQGTAVSLTPTNTGGAMTYGLVSTLAGDGSYGDVDGPGNAASFNGLMGVAVDAVGNVYVVDIQNQKVRKITPEGNVSTFAGSGLDGTDDGNGSDASFSYPVALAVDALGYVYVIDNNSHKIRKISPDRDVSTFMGIGYNDYDINGNPANFLNPNGIVVDADGNVYIVDSSNNQIKKITSAGELSILAGSGAQGSVNGFGSSASFNNPQGIAVDASGNIYVADSGNHKIRKITSAGVVSTLAGSGSRGAVNGTVNSASFNEPYGVAVDASGNVYVADTGNSKIRKISPSGEVSAVAGSSARSVAVDASGNVYVVDGGNNITKMDSNGGYSVTPQLPSGLTINPSTGVIGGTPTAVSAQTNYTVTATNRFGTATAIINISVGIKPVIGYATPQTYLVGTTMTDLTPTSTGGSITGYSVVPSLPAGLSIDTATGTISGTPTAAALPNTYTVTATNSFGTAYATVEITVGEKPLIAYIAPPAFAVGTSITDLTPTSSGGIITGYSVTPSLPSGLVMDTNTGVFSGTPKAVSASNTYTVTATNSFGTATATVLVEVKPASLAGTIAGATAVCSGANSVDLILSGNVGTIQWESSTDNWATYTAVGTNSTTFTATNIASTTSYRAVVTSGVSPSAITASVNIIVNPESVSGLIDGVAPVCLGTNSVNLILSGSTGTIQWQKSTNGVIFTDINGATSANYTATDLTASYMAIVTSGACPSVSTAPITITVLREVLAPTGDSQQPLSQGKKISDIVIQKDPNGVIQWYKTQADALADLNTLLTSDLLESGYYYAMQTIGGCRSITPLEVAVTVTLGVNEFHTTELRYYPNPVEDLLTISYDHEINSVKVFDILGQQIITVSPNSQNAKIDMAGLPMGNYLLQVSAQGKSTIIKVIKK